MSEINNKFDCSEGLDTDLEQILFKKAWESEEFKELLLKDATTAIKQLFPDVQLPDGLKIVVHEDKPDLVNIALPANPEDSQGAY